MEEMIDFDKWLSEYEVPEVRYVAVYDKDTGKVISVGPKSAFPDEKFKVFVDTEIAELILKGTISIHSCFVDPMGDSLEITEMKSVFKIDDVVHRVIDKRWSGVEIPDIYITYDTTSKTLKIELTEDLNGTYIQAEEFQPRPKRSVHWGGDTLMNFLLTDYNDPNVLIKMLSVRLDELVGQAKIFENINLPEKFSVYTRRIFKSYVLQIL